MNVSVFASNLDWDVFIERFWSAGRFMAVVTRPEHPAFFSITSEEEFPLLSPHSCFFCGINPSGDVFNVSFAVLSF